MEQRVMLTTTLFVDFGDRFTGAFGLTTNGTNQVTQADLRDTINGPVLPDTSSPAHDLPDTATLTFTSFATQAANAGLTTAQTTEMRTGIMTLMQRYYEPFDINIVELTATGGNLGAATLTDIRTALDANNGAAEHNDAYMLVAGIAGSTAIHTTAAGVAGGNDVYSTNLTDDSAVVLANNIFASIGTNVGRGDNWFAYTTAHEAGHTLGLWHTINGDPGDNRLLTTSDVMSQFYNSAASGNPDADQRDNFSFFTRYPLAQAHGIGGTQNAHDAFANDPNIGLRAGAAAYITGTGAFDRITLSSGAAADLVDVSVEAHRNASFTDQIGTTLTYTVNSANGLLVDLGYGADQLTVNANINAGVTVRGMAGDDHLVVLGNGAVSANYQAGQSTQTTGLDGKPDIRGTINIGATRINFQEFESTGSVVVQDVGTLSLYTYGPHDHLTLASAATAGRNRISGYYEDVARTTTIPIVPLEFSNVTDLLIDTGPSILDLGEDTVVVQSAAAATGLNTLRINTGFGTDVVTVDVVNGNPIPAGGMNLNLGTGNATGPDKLVLRNGWQITETLTGPTSGQAVFTDTALAILPAVQFTGAEVVSSEGLGVAYVEVHLPDTSDDVTLNGTLHSNTAAFPDVEFNHGPVFQVLTVFAGNGDDRVNVMGGTGAKSMVVMGEAGRDTLISSGEGVAYALLVLNGGADNDTFLVSARKPGVSLSWGPSRIEGDEGNDLVRILCSTSFPLLPTEVGNDFAYLMRSIEFLDLTSASVRIYGTYDGLAAMMGPSKTLIVTSDSNDQVDLGAGWNMSFLNEVIGGAVYKVFRQSMYTVKISDSTPTPIYYIGGGGQDKVEVSPAGGGKANIFVWGRLMGVYTASRIVLSGGDGPDNLVANAALTIPCEFHGGNGDDWIVGALGDDLLFGDGGNDKIEGRQGNDIIVGGSGNDELRGVQGWDLLIGGAGRDRLLGDELWHAGGQDLLISGTTDYDDSPSALGEILKAWTDAATSYVNRVAALQSGVGPLLDIMLLAGVTVHDDGQEDWLSGYGERDWYFARPGVDKLTDRVPDERLDPLP